MRWYVRLVRTILTTTLDSRGSLANVDILYVINVCRKSLTSSPVKKTINFTVLKISIFN